MSKTITIARIRPRASGPLMSAQDVRGPFLRSRAGETSAVLPRTDGTVVRVLRGGKERPFRHTAMRPMTEAEVSAAAAADPDARPMTADQLRTARRIPRIRTLRRPWA